MTYIAMHNVVKVTMARKNRDNIHWLEFQIVDDDGLQQEITLFGVSELPEFEEVS